MFFFSKDIKATLDEKIETEMKGMRATHVPGSPGWDWFLKQPILKKSDSACEVQDLVGENRTLLDFTTNNYLGIRETRLKIIYLCFTGLSSNKEVKQAGIEAIENYGAGVCSARLLGGNIDLTDQLEKKMAKFLKRDAALVYSSSYAVNLGIFGKLLGKEDAIFSDKSNHASLIDGIR